MTVNTHGMSIYVSSIARAATEFHRKELERTWDVNILVCFFKSITNIYIHNKIYMYIIGMYNAYAGQ